MSTTFNHNLVTQTQTHSQQERKTTYGLAPMEGVTDFATRLWMAQTAAPDEACTPFLRVTRDYPPKRISATFLPEIELSKEHGVVSCIPQLMASETGDLIRIAEHFLKRVPFVDINCGCPSPTVVGHGAGSSLLQSPEKFRRYLGEIVSALGAGRVSVKMRVGFLNEAEFPELLDVVNSFPLARLTIHGRTRQDRYRGKARWSHMALAAERMSCPVVGSGDIFDVATFDERLRSAPGVSGVIVGRGALRNPWLFHQLKAREPRLVVSRQLFRARLLLFVLLQEALSQNGERLIELVKRGFFARSGVMDGEQASEFNERLASVFFENNENDRKSEQHWIVSRNGIARGKLLWNYLRSSLPLPAERSVGLLRSTDWLSFLNALQDVLLRLPEHDVGAGYHSDWDWVYSGAPSSHEGEKGSS